MTSRIEISYRTIVFTVFFLIFLYVLYQVRQLLTVFFISLVFMSALNPSVNRLERLKIPRILAILTIYFIIFILFGLVVAGIIPPLVSQTSLLISRLPEYLQALGFSGINQDILIGQVNQLGSIPGNVLKITLGVFNNILSFFILAVITFYLLIERKRLDRHIHFLFGVDGEKRAQKFIDEMEKKLGGWVRAQGALMLIIGLVSYFGLRLLGIDFALPLALLAGVLEVVPNVGPTLAAVPAVLAGLAISPLMGLAVAALYFLIQQIENGFILPQIMSRGAGVNPLVAIMALVAGFQLGGVIGAVLAIPLVLLVQVVAAEFFSQKFPKFQP